MLEARSNTRYQILSNRVTTSQTPMMRPARHHTTPLSSPPATNKHKYKQQPLTGGNSYIPLNPDDDTINSSGSGRWQNRHHPSSWSRIKLVGSVPTLTETDGFLSSLVLMDKYWQVLTSEAEKCVYSSWSLHNSSVYPSLTLVYSFQQTDTNC